MNAILVILGVLGLGAIVISAFVFTVAARNYVTQEDNSPRGDKRGQMERRETDRRSGEVVSFPLIVNGVVVATDRRKRADRRLQAA